MIATDSRTTGRIQANIFQLDRKKAPDKMLFISGAEGSVPNFL